MRYSYGLMLTLLISLTVLSGCDRKDTPTTFDTVDVGTPNNFLKYPNSFPSLPAGSYTLVAATTTVGINDNFVLTVSYDDGSTQTYTGSWTNSGGQDPQSTDNKRFTINLSKAGGLIATLQATADTYLYLLDRSDNVLFEDDNSGGGTRASINLPKSKIDNAAWTSAYYTAIDPMNERTTLSDWKTKNGFDTGEDIHVIFRDTKDLGYGRDMHVRSNNKCLAVYVRNFAVNIVDGMPYNTLNLTAAVANDTKHHFGTNAIEFSDLQNKCDGTEPLFAKFYTFKAYPQNPTADETRIDKINLDHRGDKFMPGPCIICHGGTAYPLVNGVLPSAALPGAINPEKRQGDVNARMQPLEVDTFEFSDVAGYSRAEQETKLHDLNNMVYETFQNSSSGPGEWTGNFIREVVNGWYNGDITNPVNTTFDTTFVPDGWKYDPADNNPPASSNELFLKVVKPYCFACHSKRGSDLCASTTTAIDANAHTCPNNEADKDIDFSTYNKFIGHAARIENYVYVRGLMPLSRLTYDKFWASDAPAILASHIPGFSHGNLDGSINQPGAPIANPGLDRTTDTPVTLSAASSLFARSYSWSVTSAPVNSVYSFDNNGVSSTRIDPEFNTDTDGTYVLQLIVSNGSESSAPETLTLTVNNTPAVAAKEITFTTDIKPVIQDTNIATAFGCGGCHTDTSGVAGIPVWYKDSTSTDDHQLYLNILLRVNFTYPELSALLLKPSGNHHFGGLRPGFDLSGDKTQYNLFLNWILNGAREN